MGQSAAVISIVVQGYGIVIWTAADAWRVYSPTPGRSAILSARVELALRAAVPGGRSDHDIIAALLSIRGAHLFAVDCDHGPGECEGDEFWG